MKINPIPSAIYFEKSKKIAKKFQLNNLVTMQFFQRQNNVKLCGINHVLELIKTASKNYQQLTVATLLDGSIINDNEVVLSITGKYVDFAFLEGRIDGILCAETTICTNSYRVVQAAQGLPIIYMNDRNSHLENHKYDGYAAYIGGIRHFTSQEQLKLIPNLQDCKLIGTIPHSLIQLHHGDLIKTMEHYVNVYPNEPLVALVDYKNNIIEETLTIASHFPKLQAVRIDTSPTLIDQWFIKNYNPVGTELAGINAKLIKKLRQELDNNNYQAVKIIVSSGMNPDMIKKLITEQAPINMIGVGFYLQTNPINFTGDSVLLDNQPQAKIGRKYQPSNKLKIINWKEINGQ